MILDKLKEEIIQLLQHYFPLAKIDTNEKRGIIFELRAYIDEAAFIEIYANYKGWHYHPPDEPNNHIPCTEPSINSILQSFTEALKMKN